MLGMFTDIYIVKTELLFVCFKAILSSRNNVDSSNQNPHEAQGKYSCFPVCVISTQANLIKANTGVSYIYHKHAVECGANVLSVKRDLELAEAENNLYDFKVSF